MEIDEQNLKQGVLGLVVALVEIVRDALRHQALRRMESGRLSEAEVDRLGEALFELDGAIDEIKVEMGLAETVRGIREGLDRAVDDLIHDFAGQDTRVATAGTRRPE